MSSFLARSPPRMIVRRPFVSGCSCGCFHHGLPGPPRTAPMPSFRSRQQTPRHEITNTPTPVTVASRCTLASAMHDVTFKKNGRGGWPRETGQRREFNDYYHEHHEQQDSHIDHTHHDGDSSQHGRHARLRRRHTVSWPKSKNPTPYEIFNLEKDAEYTKVRFYDLVKQYHPDHHHHHIPEHLSGVSPSTKLERYRLVVAANNILSNPTKRRAYDLYGLGWADGEDVDIQSRYRNLGRNWRQKPGSPVMNATWEDWERWHYEQASGAKQEPQFMSNGSFALVVVVFVILGSWGQITRIGNSSMNLVGMRDENHNTIRDTLVQQQIENARLSREERVDSFLERREGWGYVLPPTPRRDSTASYESEANGK